MEKITPEVIAHTAMLSRITLTKEESAAMEKHFAALLGQMAALEGFDASAVPATAHILPAVNVLRACAPDRDANSYIVPRVVE